MVAGRPSVFRPVVRLCQFCTVSRELTGSVKIE